MVRKFLTAMATLIGMVIGAGILGIPYVVAQAGFWTGITVTIVLGVIIALLNLFLGEIILRTKGNHQLTGYSEIYLGKWGKRLMTISMILGIYGALIAYLIGEGEALAAIFNIQPILGLAPSSVFSLLFFIVFSMILYFGLNVIANSELFLGGIMLFIVLLISIFTLPFTQASNYTSFDFYKIFLPYGVIFFAFIGTAAIPEMKEILSHNRKSMKSAIILSSLFITFIYLLFGFMVVGATGLETSEIATIGLGKLIGPKMILFGNLFAVFAMSTSFLALGLALKEMYHYDYKLNEILSWLLTISIPLLLFLLGVKSFIKVLGITGAIAGGIDGILIVLMFWKAKKEGRRKPEYEIKKSYIISGVLILTFLFGILYVFKDLF